MKTIVANRNQLVFILVVILIGFGTQSSYGQTIAASVSQPLTEANLPGSIITLTLSGGTYERSRFTIEREMTLSGIDGVTVAGFFGIDRVSDTVVTVELEFDGNIDADGTLTFTVGADAIAGYSGNALTATVPVTALAESLEASTGEDPLTEATLHGSVVTLTLSGRFYEQWIDGEVVTVSGIDGVTFEWWDVDRLSDTEITVELTFDGDFDTDDTLIFTVGADAIAGYNEALIAQVPVTAIQESLVASTASSLTETNLHGSVVTLTLNGRNYTSSARDIRNAVTVSGIDGVATRINRVSDTKVTVALTFNGGFDTDATLTFTVGAGAIAGYNEALTAQVTVTATQESLTVSTASPLTETTLHGSVVTLTLSGRTYEWSIPIDAVTISGIDGITFERWDVDRLSDTEVTVELTFSGDLDTDATLTFTVGADAIAGYDGNALIATVPVTAVAESLTASTASPLMEATLHGSIVTLTLEGRIYEEYSFEIGDALTVSGIDGVTFERWNVERVSDTEATVELIFDGTDFDTDTTLTFTVGAEGIAEYNGQAFTEQILVTAVEQSNATVSISPSPMLVPAIREQFTFSLNITNGENIAGYQATVSFDDSALRYVESANSDYLPAGAFFTPPIVRSDWVGETPFGEPIVHWNVTLAANTLAGAANGDGTLATLTFEVEDFKPSTLILSQVYLVDSDGTRWEATTQNGTVTIPSEPAEPILGDINRDGVVNIQDLVIVHSRFGQRGQNSADLNGDGLVNIADLVLVAGAFGGEAAAPSLYPQASELLTAAAVRRWLLQAQGLHLTDPTFQRGIHFLEQLLTALTPKETTLLPNYPNPFNPETWIPYRLAEDAFVTLTIYDGNGQVVRTLDVGHRVAAFYESRSKAIYWDGKNEFSEQVASGVYFYHLSAGGFSATRRMLILK